MNGGDYNWSIPIIRPALKLILTQCKRCSSFKRKIQNNCVFYRNWAVDYSFFHILSAAEATRPRTKMRPCMQLLYEVSPQNKRSKGFSGLWYILRLWTSPTFPVWLLDTPRQEGLNVTSCLGWELAWVTMGFLALGYLAQLLAPLGLLPAAVSWWHSEIPESARLSASV